MAITVSSISKPYSIGDRFVTVSSVALDNNYPTGGYALSQADLGFAATVDPEFNVECDAANGWSALYDHTNHKLMLYAGTVSASAQVTNGTDVSAVTALRVKATGKYRG
jgi:hypothetical protein